MIQYIYLNVCNHEGFGFASFVFWTEILLDLESAIDYYDVPSEGGITKPGMYV